MDRDRLARAIERIDAANAEDPNQVSRNGVTRPKELVHAELVTAWVIRLRPSPSEELLIAARAHHFQRWTVPRSSYPDGRAAYLRWRRDLSERQADQVGRMLGLLDYPSPVIERIKAIMCKRNLARDGEVQALEDAICLVFLETQFADLADRLDHARMIEVLRKTTSKMSSAAVELVDSIALSDRARALLREASSLR